MDAVVVGSGPNGLAAAITLARAGLRVTVLEAADEPGGGSRSAELTLPGFVHDVCSSIHVFGRISPFFADLEPALAAHGLRWIRPPAALGHPLDDGSAVLLRGDVDETARGLGGDGDAYRDLLRLDGRRRADAVAGPARPVPRAAVAAAGAADGAVRAAGTAAGDAGRATLPGRRRPGAVRGDRRPLDPAVDRAGERGGRARARRRGTRRRLAVPRGRRRHAAPRARRRAGGARRAGRDGPAGGKRWTSCRPTGSRCSTRRPAALVGIAGDRLPAGYRRRLEGFRHGPGVFKLDLAIDGPIPWRAPELLDAATVHLGGTLEEIARGEAEVAAGRVPDRPFVLLTQASLFDPTRAPAGRHTVWAYCHVPNGSTVDATDRIVGQIERFAPGFRDRILASAATGPARIEAANANNVGGDIAGGRFDLRQLFTRPSLRILDPYSTPNPAIYLCSASTPPGGGVHGVSGMLAARSALRRLG